MFQVHPDAWAQAIDPDGGHLPSGVHNLLRNKHGGLFIRGATYDLLTKLRVADAIYLARRGGEKLVVSRVSVECGVTDRFVRKIRDELDLYGRVLSVKETRKIQQQARSDSGAVGVGAHTIDAYAKYILYALYTDEPYRSLRSYQDWLNYFTGIRPSKSTISRFLKSGFVHPANFVKPNMVPYDKFRPDNIAKAYEYIELVLDLDPERLVFADEKLLKGQELFNREVRRDSITGEKPCMVPDPDFRNTHSVTGFCLIAGDRKPLIFRIHEGNNDAEQFSIDVESAIGCGWLRPFDVLVIDNAAYHIGRENVVLEDWLWDNHNIFMLQLPPRSPEWNPIELIWNILVQRLRSCDLREAREHSFR